MDNEKEQNTTSETFFNLYQKVFNDESVVKINDAPGITIVRKYDEKSEYFKDAKRIFVKLYIIDGYVTGSVDMVQKREGETFTIIHDTGQYKKHFTNFYFSKEENIVFNSELKKFLIKRKNKIHKYNINDFVSLLIKNHTADKLFFKRKINKSKKIFLEIIFWFMDSKYDWEKYYSMVHKKEQIANKIDGKDNLDFDFNILKIEPFFNYFNIYRKILLLFIVIITGIILYFFKNIDIKSCTSINDFCTLFRAENLTIANPVLLFLFFIILFLLHYFSLFLQKKVDDKNGFIYRLHSSAMNDSFSLKIYKEKDL